MFTSRGRQILGLLPPNTEGPSMVQTSDISAAVNTDKISDISAAANTDETSDISSAPNTGEISDILSAPSKAQISDNFSAPSTARTSEIFSTPSTAETLDISSASNTGETSNIFSAPSSVKTPDIFPQPSMAETSDVCSPPSTAKTSDIFPASSTAQASNASPASSVAKTLNKGKPKRCWDRQNFCLFCLTTVTNFTRHLVRKHRHEKEVIDYLAIDDANLKERKRKREKLSENLRVRGNHLYNETLLYSDTPFLPVRRSNSVLSDITDYTTCVHCERMLAKKTFYLHLRKCSKAPREAIEEAEELISRDGVIKSIFPNKIRKPVQKSDGIRIIPEAAAASDLLKRRIVPIMHLDKIGKVATTDPLILKLGSTFLSNHLENKDVHNVSQKMRDAANFVLECRKNTANFTFTDCFNPLNFWKLADAIQSMSKYEKDTGHVGVTGMPARVSTILHAGKAGLHSAALTNISGLSQQDKEVRLTELNEFSTLLKDQWKYIISTNAEKTRKKKRCLKQVIMPDDEDIKAMAERIRLVELKVFKALAENVTPLNYENLCCATIAHILILNRRRPGEAARAEMIYWTNRPVATDLTQDAIDQLTIEEKVSLNELEVLLVPGKLVRTVPILLTKQMSASVELIISCRDKLSVKNKELLFSRVKTHNSFDGGKILNKFKNSLKLKKAGDMTCTGLRHHFATKTQLHGNDSYKNKVCDFMGHTKAVHDTRYRESLQTAQRGQVGKNMLQMAGETCANVEKTSEKISQNIQRDDEIIMSNTEESDGEILPHVSENQENSSSNINEDNSQPETTQLINSPEPASKSSRNHSSPLQPFKLSPGDMPLKSVLCDRNSWTMQQKKLLLDTFSDCFGARRAPGYRRCQQLIDENPILLQGRTKQTVNIFIDNLIRKKSKMPEGYSLLLAKKTRSYK